MIFDSLPYYDNDLEQFSVLREKVEKELACEAKPAETLHPGVPPPATLFTVSAVNISLRLCYMTDLCLQNHPLLKAELARIESHHPLAPLDTTRHQMPGPQNPASEVEWKAALENAHAQLQHQSLR